MPIEASTALGLKGDRKLVEAGFSWKPRTSPVLAHLDHAEARNLVGRNGQRGQRDLGLGLLVVLQHPAVVHLVDVVAGEMIMYLGCSLPIE
jgi:hypothetical protein